MTVLGAHEINMRVRQYEWRQIMMLAALWPYCGRNATNGRPRLFHWLGRALRELPGVKLSVASKGHTGRSSPQPGSIGE